MQTHLKYLENTYLFADNAVLRYISQDDKGVYAILDSTIMYPQGGGQPSDKGEIVTDAEKVEVTLVGFVDGEVRHYGNFQNHSISNMQVKILVDEELRIRNAKLHTAGHLITSILYEKLTPELNPIKGFHFPEGSYVEFLGVKPQEVEKTIEKANQLLADDLQNKLTIISEIVSFGSFDVNDVLLPKNFDFPKDKPMRIVKIGNYKAIPCGGTHIANLSQIKTLKVTKIKNKGENVKVSYVVE